MKKMRDKHSMSFAGAKKIYNDEAVSLRKLRDLVKIEAQHLMKIIKVKQKELGLTNKDTIIAGFSQGGFLGLYLT